MAQGYLPVDTPPGTKPLPLGVHVPAKAGGGGGGIPTGKRPSLTRKPGKPFTKKGKRPSTKKRSLRGGTR